MIIQNISFKKSILRLLQDSEEIEGLLLLHGPRQGGLQKLERGTFITVDINQVHKI